MNVKRTLTLVAAGGAAITWLAGAATSNRDVPPPIIAPRPAIDMKSDDLAKEIARLHDRLRPDAAPRQPARNLFAFHTAPAPQRLAPPPLPIPAPAITASAPAVPALKLDGIAEDEGADGPVRTAIISAAGQLFLAKPGDAVTSRYRVARIAADVVELTDTVDGSMRRLPLK